jgi:uncharacterized alkaline shock family protein YloU
MSPDTTPVAGSVKVSPAVVRSVAALATADVPGVVAIGKRRTPLQAGHHDGVRATVNGDVVVVDIDLTVDGAYNLTEVGRRVIRSVTEMIERTIGFTVEAVNVRIQDVA